MQNFHWFSKVGTSYSTWPTSASTLDASIFLCPGDSEVPKIHPRPQDHFKVSPRHSDPRSGEAANTHDHTMQSLKSRDKVLLIRANKSATSVYSWTNPDLYEVESTAAERRCPRAQVAKLGWTNQRIQLGCKWLGNDLVKRWTTRGRSRWDSAADAEQTGGPVKLSGRALGVASARLAATFAVHPSTLHRNLRAGRLKVKVQRRRRQSVAQRAYRVE